MGHQYFQHHHPPSPCTMHDTTIMPADQILFPFDICGCHVMFLSSATILPHPQSIDQSQPFFFLSDLPSYLSTCALFHFSQWPVKRRKKQCLWWESRWNKWGGNFPPAIRGPSDWWPFIFHANTWRPFKTWLTQTQAFSVSLAHK